jgi:hypothetical protein
VAAATNRSVHEREGNPGPEDPAISAAVSVIHEEDEDIAGTVPDICDLIWFCSRLLNGTKLSHQKEVRQ